MDQVVGYRYRSTIHEGMTTLVSRAVREDNDLRVVIKAHKRRVPVPVEVARFRRERDILSRIESDHVISCLGLAEQGNRLSLIIEDFGGESLDKLIASRPLTLYEFLEIALQVVQALGDIHAAGVVHGNINAANIVWHSETGQLKIIDFSTATAPWLPLPLPTGERQLQGNLAYMSPEQTGRLNRAIDHRSDFYSLGATLYALLINAPPFSSADTLEIVHAHLARMPTPPHERNPSVPAAVSNIVMKLLSKVPEERYQSARGIRRDLRYCLNQLRAGHSVPDAFTPGRHDVPEIFGISGKLYGRSAERDVMAEALTRAARGRAELALLYGPSGVGKSSLAFEFGRQATGLGGHFVSGKFDQITTGAPYSAIAAAFQQLMGDLLNAKQKVRDRYRPRLLERLGDNAGIIVDMVPQLELVIGAQPPVPVLPLDATQNRFHLVFKQFIAAVASKGHPLVLFLDDLQWADRASFSLVTELVIDPAVQNLLIIGAYRAAEIGSTHPLMQTLRRLQEDRTTFVDMELSPLTCEDVAELLEDTFQSSRTAFLPLANALIDKTDGNPFLMHRLLTQLHDNEFFRFDASRNRWSWDVGAIRTIGPEGAASDLVNSTLRALPTRTQDLLSKAACFGLRFDLERLALVTGEDRSDVLQALRPAIMGHLLATVPTTLPQEEGGDGSLSGRFSFVHDQVLRAAYELIPESLRDSVHLDIGRRLLGGRAFDELGESAYEVLEHLNRGRALIKHPNERLGVIRLNFEAALSAKAASAYGEACECFEAARRLLTADAWHEQHELTRQIYLGRAETEYLVGDVQRARQLIEVALQHTESPVKRAELHDLLAVQHTLQGEYGEAMRIGREALGALGVELPATGIRDALEHELSRVTEWDPEDVFPKVTEESSMRDPKIQAVMGMLMNLLPPSDFTEPDLNSWIAVKMVNLSQEFGCVPESAKGFVNLGNVLTVRGDYERGYAFGRLGVSVVEHFGAIALKPRVLYTLVTYLNHWMNPLRDSCRLGDEAFRACLDVGELQYAGYVLAFHKTMNEIFLGQDLDTVRDKLDEYLRFSTKTKNNLASCVVLAAYNTVANLHGDVPGHAAFDSDLVTEKGLLTDCESRGNYMAICLFRLLQAHALLLYGDHQGALLKVKESAVLMDYVSTTMPAAILPFVEAMILSGMYNSAQELRDADCWKRLLSHRDANARWEALCPDNFEAPSVLIQAEVARLEGRHIEAMRLYDRASEAATGVGFIPINALANERAGRFWLGLGKHDFAKGYLERAYARYARWGATRKLDRLAEEFPELAGCRTARGRDASSTSNDGLPRNIDFEAVTKMSQAIASELRLDRLLGTLVKLLIEAAGAQRAVLFRTEPDGLKVEAVGDVDSDKPVVLQSIPVADAKVFPLTVVDFVARTKSEVVLDDARTDEHYSVDPYVRHNAVKSLLCLPIIQRQSLAGLVYLENRLAAGVFTADRVGLVRVLAAEAAIAINNALVFGTVERKVEQRTAELVEATQLAEEARLTAEAANRAKSDFLANMSHELRTPLNAILGYTELILDHVYGEVSDQTREALERVDKNGRHLLDLINDVLDLSKIEAGGFTLSINEYSMVELVRSVMSTVEPLGAEKNLALGVSLPSDLPIGRGNEQRITQVLLNLIGNAIKFTDAGEISVDVTVSGENFVVSVSDTGIGISEADQEKIFKEFQRVDNSATRETGGTGLGLAIAKRMIEMQGGHMWVQSTLEKGSTFSFSLPIDVGPQMEAT
jgi:predicted ATPase/signal transduction histidine kinase